MFTVRLASPKSSKNRVIGMMHDVVLALAKRGSLFREHADDRVGVPAHRDDFADGRFVREQSFLDHLSDDDHAPRKLDIFFVQIAAVAERVGVGGEKALIRADNEKARRRLHAVVNGLSFHIVTKTLRQISRASPSINR